MKAAEIYCLTNAAREFFAPEFACDFFRVVDTRANGVRVIRPVALLADGSEQWRATATFEVGADELAPVPTRQPMPTLPRPAASGHHHGQPRR